MSILLRATSPVVIVRRYINLFIMIAFERHDIDITNYETTIGIMNQRLGIMT
jgi:hypothetical protein